MCIHIYFKSKSACHIFIFQIMWLYICKGHPVYLGNDLCFHIYFVNDSKKVNNYLVILFS